MAQARGYRESLLFSLESGFSVTPDPASAVRLPMLPNPGLAAKQSQTQSEVITGSRNPVQPFRGNIDAGGDMTVPLDVRAFPWWLLLAMGAPATTGVGPYTHVFKIADELPSATLELGFASPFANYLRYPGCKVNQLGFKFGGDGELNVSVGIMGADESVNTTSMDADPATVVYERYHQFHASIEEGGASIATVTECEFTLNNQLDGSVYTIGAQGKRREIPEGLGLVSGSIKALFSSQALYQKAVLGTESSLKLTVAMGAHSMELLAPELMFERAGLARNGPAGVFVTLPFAAYHRADAGNSALTVTVINDVATYAAA